MSSRKSKPQWWQLYVGLPALAGLFVVEIRLGLQGAENVIAQLGILFLIYMFMQVWIRANRGALMELDERAPERQEPYGVRVYQFPPAERVMPSRVPSVSGPRLDIPHGEIKGVLSTTFEMDAEDADSVFRPRAENPGPDDTLRVRNSRRPSNKATE